VLLLLLLLMLVMLVVLVMCCGVVWVVEMKLREAIELRWYGTIGLFFKFIPFVRIQFNSVLHCSTSTGSTSAIKVGSKPKPSDIG
jgi:hypothetical protein